jgi:hypothetical protein
MSLDVLIARWLAIFWILAGLSHFLHPAKWAALLLPLRDRDTGGFILAAMSLPVGLFIILGHKASHYPELDFWLPIPRIEIDS